MAEKTIKEVTQEIERIRVKYTKVCEQIAILGDEAHKLEEEIFKLNFILQKAQALQNLN